MRCTCEHARAVASGSSHLSDSVRGWVATMSALTAIARGMARRQLAGLIVLGVAGGLGLGVAMAAVTDARRADTAYTRQRHASLAPDALFDATGLQDQDLDRLAAIPGVTGIARFSYTPVAPSALVPGQDAGAFVGFDPDFLVRVYRPVALSGRSAAWRPSGRSSAASRGSFSVAGPGPRSPRRRRWSITP